MKPLQYIGIPALAVNEHGRIVSWNDAAADFFQRPVESTLGREWHTVVRSINTESCCPLCTTRHALRHGKAAHPVEVTLTINGRHQPTMLVPMPTSADIYGNITFLIIDQRPAGACESVSRAPIPIRSGIRRLDDDRLIDELTVREREILACVVDGFDARGIAAELGISHATARNYVQRILTKLGVRNKAEAVSVALTYNLLAS